jgi:hypothetical protein
MATTRAERRRQRIEALIRADIERSNRSIAEEIGHCSHNTVARVRAGLTGSLTDTDGPVNGPNGQHPENLIAPAGPGNTRAATHSAYSAAALRPAIETLTTELPGVVAGYTSADDVVIRMLAVLIAQIEQVNAYVADVGIFKKPGELRPVLGAQAKWINAASRLCDQLGMTPTARARLGVVEAGADGYAHYLEITQRKEQG